jgi:arylsulfatase A-like enzyme
VDRLDHLGLTDRVVIAFVSDHGEEFFEHGRFGHNRTLFEEVVHVPLILRWPAGLPAGRCVDDLVSLADVAPTVLELAGLPRTAPLWGRSLLPAIHAELAPRTAPLDLRLFREANPLRAVRCDDYKLVRDGAEAPLVLYDLARDPGEHAPEVVGEAFTDGAPCVEGARELWADLMQRRTELDRPGDDVDRTMPEDLMQRIKDAGYAGEDEKQVPDAGEDEKN